MEFSTIFFISISYLIGSIPFAFILTKIFGLGDIRKIGSGNVGATNVLRTGKKSLAMIVLTFDIAKGFFPVTILFFFFETQLDTNLIFFIGSFSIIGHIFPFCLIFKGGKGVATLIGFLLSIDHILGSFFIISWLIIAYFKKYSSLASILSLIITPIISIILLKNSNLFVILLFLSILIIYKHWNNIKRLLRGSENKIKL